MRINFKNIKFKNELAKGYIESNIDVDLISFVAIIQKIRFFSCLMSE